jgi:hypothetical protein
LEIDALLVMDKRTLLTMRSLTYSQTLLIHLNLFAFVITM